MQTITKISIVTCSSTLWMVMATMLLAYKSTKQLQTWHLSNYS